MTVEALGGEQAGGVVPVVSRRRSPRKVRRERTHHVALPHRSPEAREHHRQIQALNERERSLDPRDKRERVDFDAGFVRPMWIA